MPGRICVVLFTPLCGACASTPEQVMPDGATSISLTGGACLGTCPDYEIYLLDEGTVHFKGNGHTRVHGRVTQRVRRPNYMRLEQFLLEQQALELGDAGDCMTDSFVFQLTIAKAFEKNSVTPDS